MRRSTIPLGRIAGIPIDIDYSWFIVFGLILLTLSTNYFPTTYPGWSAPQYWLVGFITAILFFSSVLLHELGHAVVANHYGTPVNRITLFIFGGAAQLDDEPRTAASEFMIAVAGPVVSVGLGMFYLLLKIAMPANSLLTGMFHYLMMINFVLTAFNLIPGFPLDGGRILRSVLWKVTGSVQRATRIAGGAGRLVALCFIVMGIYQALTGLIASGLWIAFIGWFLDNAARSEVRQRVLRDLLSEHYVSEITLQPVETIGSALTLQELIETRGLSALQKAYMVRQPNGDMAGILTPQQIQAIPQELWASTTAAQVAIPVDQMKRVQPQAELWEAVQLMEKRNLTLLPVMEDNHLMGLLRREDVANFMRMQREFSTS